MAKFSVRVYGGLARCVAHTVWARDNGRLGKYDFYIYPQFVEANFICSLCEDKEEKAGLAITESSKKEQIVLFAGQADYKLSDVEQQECVPLKNVKENNMP